MAASTTNQQLDKKKKWTEKKGFKTCITLLALFFVTPIGIWLVWWWCDWSKPIKIIVSILFIVLWAYSQYLARFVPRVVTSFAPQVICFIE